MTYREAIVEANKILRNSSGLYEARYLLLELCKEQGLDLYTIEDQEMPKALKSRFFEGIERLLKEEPIAHILGYTWFYGRKFHINNQVLIPRNETEQLVMQVLLEVEAYFSNLELDIVDIGCGSGAIGLSLKAEEPSFRVSLTDISEKAIQVAKKNAKLIKIDVDFYKGNLLEPIRELKFDVIVCNPPYIKKTETIASSVLDFEPHLALFGGEDGLYFYRKLFKDITQVIKKRAILALEIGYDLAEELVLLIEKELPNVDYKVMKDYQGHFRMLFLYFNNGCI